MFDYVRVCLNLIEIARAYSRWLELVRGSSRLSEFVRDLLESHRDCVCVGDLFIWLYVCLAVILQASCQLEGQSVVWFGKLCSISDVSV